MVGCWIIHSVLVSLVSCSSWMVGAYFGCLVGCLVEWMVMDLVGLVFGRSGMMIGWLDYIVLTWLVGWLSMLDDWCLSWLVGWLLMLDTWCLTWLVGWLLMLDGWFADIGFCCEDRRLLQSLWEL